MGRCVDCYSSTCNCSHPRDLFGSPFHCQKRKRTHRFASPNSPLNQEELDELQACIEAANDLLRSLGSERDEDNTRQLQLHFLEMKGEIVSANGICNYETPEDEESSTRILIERLPSRTFCLSGKIATAGKDFLQINQYGSSAFIFYKNLLSIEMSDCVNECEMEPEFIDAEQDLRRKLAFNFGEFVSKNPNFINLFFGIPLYKMLKQYIGKEFKVFTPEKMFSGTLIGVEEDNVKLFNKEGELRFSLQEICYLKVFNLK